MGDDRLARPVAFLVEADRLKSVLRRTPLTDDSRPESSAEHSRRLALAAMTTRSEQNPEPGRALHPQIASFDSLPRARQADHMPLICRTHRYANPQSWVSLVGLVQFFLS
jgi:HD domain